MAIVIKRLSKNANLKKCPHCGSKLRSNTPQGRNAPVANFTEKFACSTLNKALNKINKGDLEAKRSVICDKLGLNNRSEADVAVVKKGNSSRIYEPEEIKLIFEIKMSLVWNWEPKSNQIEMVSDYDKHCGRGSIYRTDSILKAIGKGAIFRSHKGSNQIPYIVIGNCPPAPGYFDKIDGSVRSGIIQKFLSLNPEPLIIDKSDKNKRNPKNSEGDGYLRIDTIEELSEIIKYYLESEQVFIGAMIKNYDLGKLIKSLNLSNSPEEIGHEFFEKIYRE